MKRPLKGLMFCKLIYVNTIAELYSFVRQIPPAKKRINLFKVSCRCTFLSFLFVLSCIHAMAQKPFTEGVIVYKIKLESPDQKMFTGTYTFTFKGPQIRKELKLDNGYQDIELFNVSAGQVYSLQNMNGKKYAIQLNMNDILKAQEKFAGYSVSNEEGNTKHIAGCAAYKANLSYKDGIASEVYYTKDWRPANTITFERFPDAKFLPLNYSYKDENGISMHFEADKVSAGPVESSIFRIPPDYKMISNEEFKQLNK